MLSNEPKNLRSERIGVDDAIGPRIPGEKVSLLGKALRSFEGRYALLILLLMATSTALSLSYSSISLFDTPEYQATSFGMPRGIRADEWNRSTPVLLGRDSALYSTDNAPNLAAHLRESPVEVVMRTFAAPDQFLISVLLDDRAVSYRLMRPIFLSLIGVFLLARALGVTRARSIAITALIVSAPATVWWSFHPLEYIGPLSLGAGALVYLGNIQRLRIQRECPREEPEILDGEHEGGFQGPNRHRIRVRTSQGSDPIFEFGNGRRASPLVLGVLSLACGSWMAAGLGGYPIWGLPIAFMIWTVVASQQRKSIVGRSGGLHFKKLNFSPIAAALLGFTATYLVKLWDQRKQLKILSETVYPGNRSSTSNDLRGLSPFGDALSWVLPWLRDGDLRSLNQSEWAVGFLGLFIVSLIVSLVLLRVDRTAWIPLSICLLVVIASTLPLPDILYRIPVISLFPTYRLAQISYLLLLISAIPMFRPTRMREVPFARAAWVTALLLVLVGLRDFSASFSAQSRFGSATFWLIFVGSFALALLIAWPESRTIGLGTFAIISTTLAFTVNPITFGFGALRDSSVAAGLRSVHAEERSINLRWATDDWFLDSLIAANGLPMVSGQQSLGPNWQNYSLLDPDHRFVNEWNRGASSVKFEWGYPEEDVVIFAPTPDSVVIRIDPCGDELAALRVAYLVSTRPLPEAACLEEEQHFVWWHADRWVYRRI